MGDLLVFAGFKNFPLQLRRFKKDQHRITDNHRYFATERSSSSSSSSTTSLGI